MPPSLVLAELNHLCPPPKLPGKREHNLDEIEASLTDRFASAVSCLGVWTHKVFENLVDWAQISHVIRCAKELNITCRLNRSLLVYELSRLDPGCCLILYIVEQNAGLTISRQTDPIYGDMVHFEAFEASATADQVLSSKGPLVREFPGNAVSMEFKDFKKHDFVEALASFCEKISEETISKFAATAHKAGSTLTEVRNTADPAAVTQLLTTIIEALGRRPLSTVLTKHVHDDVSWGKGGSVYPWRRSAWWLVLRVGVQRFLQHRYGSERAWIVYKLISCIIMHDLLIDLRSPAHPELTSMVMKKLTRRLAKLEHRQESLSKATRSELIRALKAMEPRMMKTVDETNQVIRDVWNDFKEKTQRRLPKVPRQAKEEDLLLDLSNSLPHLRQMMHLPPRKADEKPADLDQALLELQNGHSDFNVHDSTASREDKIKRFLSEDQSAAQNSSDDSRRQCLQVTKMIESYLKKVAHVYEDDSVQLGRIILLVIELWVVCDRHLITLYPVIRDFKPPFTAAMLDVLELPFHHQMLRLWRVQTYLTERNIVTQTSPTIFAPPSKGCVADAFFERSSEMERLQEHYDKITATDRGDRKVKENEWAQKRCNHLSLAAKIESAQHLFIDGTTHDKGKCGRCKMEKKQKNVKIKVQENMLPSSSRSLYQARAIVFELVGPIEFSQYRDATWSIIRHFGVFDIEDRAAPLMSLPEFERLQKFNHCAQSKITLSSHKKLFSQTHYGRRKFPVELEEVCVDHGCEYSYFDTKSQKWTDIEDKVSTIAHHFTLDVPQESPYAELSGSAGLEADSRGFTSNEAIASQISCPRSISVHEWTAFHSVYSEFSRRWYTLLLELASPNLNFTSEIVIKLMSRVALQAGPNPDNTVLRQSHHAFVDENFCKQLSNQINGRLTGIEPNRREISFMSLLLKLTLRLRSLSGGFEDIGNQTSLLLGKIRRICSQWLRALKQEKHAASDPEASETLSAYAFRTALVLRETFIAFKEDTTRPDGPSLCQFFEASLSLQENLMQNTEELPRHLQDAFSNDVHQIHQCALEIQSFAEENPSSVLEAIENVWEGALSSLDIKSWCFLSQPRQHWMQIIVAGGESLNDQTVHFHILRGILLIDGQGIGALPHEHGRSDMVKELFGDQNLMATPSSLPGMQYMIWPPIKRHRIHLGYRNGRQVIRAWSARDHTLMELVPKSIFLGKDSFDLPASLVENCVHWYLIKRGEIHIRERPNIWAPRWGNWILDVNKRQAYRNRGQLVNPKSQVFRTIAQIFSDFEEPHHIVVFQPDSSIQVQLPRLKLRFRSAVGLLYCYELKAEIDPDQDVGTWYGLASKLTLRSAENHQRRHVLVPLGAPRVVRRGIHVEVRIPNSGDYGRYTVNTTLGRMDCPQLPILLYQKAMFHAYTSFVLPDGLTGRTGTEEALHCLKMGQCQPWQPLKKSYVHILNQISNLSPERHYYPPRNREMQVALFDENLTSLMQCDEYALVVQAMLDQSQRLDVFYGIESQPDDVSTDTLHLRRRALALAARYQRHDAGAEMFEHTGKRYKSRDQLDNRKSRRHVFETVSVLKYKPSELPILPDLQVLLRGESFIIGYGKPYVPVSAAEYFRIKIGPSWGQLVRSCLESTETNMHQLMFLFASLSFDEGADMKVIRTILSFALHDSLKVLKTPTWESYNNVPYGKLASRKVSQRVIKSRTLDFQDYLANRKLHNQSTNLTAAQQSWNDRHAREVETLLDIFTAKWHHGTKEDPRFLKINTIDVSSLKDVIESAPTQSRANKDHYEYLDLVQGVLLNHCCDEESALFFLPAVGKKSCPESNEAFILPSLVQLIQKPVKDLESGIESHFQRLSLGNDLLPVSQQIQVSSHSNEQSAEAKELTALVTQFGEKKSQLSFRYSNDLLQSVYALYKNHRSSPKHANFPDQKVSADLLAKSRLDVQNSFSKIVKTFEAGLPGLKWLRTGGLLPCFSSGSFLELLRSNSKLTFGTGVKDSLIRYGLAITRLQKTLRILDASDTRALRRELENTGHDGWSPFEYPDWLLIEVEADILIRKDQAEVAFATVRPQSNSNSLTQLQMGQGKTSCILPMVAAVLANSKQLLRLIIPKPLLLQTAQVMQSRLGSLVGRRIRHVPFSRRTPIAQSLIRDFMDLHYNVMNSGGVMIAAPEHILSFQLGGLQRLSDKRMIDARQMIRAQDWFENNCRDVLDESDQILSTRTQLIYPSGSEMTVDGHPWRWEVAENLLDLAQMRLPQVKKRYPGGVEIVRKSSANFPLVFFLQKEAELELSRLLTVDLLRGHLRLFPTHKCSANELKAVEEYVSKLELEKATSNVIDGLFPDNPAARTALHLSRGLLAHGVLVLCLKKRHNVTYGLHPDRDPLAVPFLAKGIPSPTAEWGHTDVSILLTVLSFYYGGLRESQLRDAFESLMRSSDPSGNYDRWTQSSAGIPVSLRHWNAINVDDEIQFREVWQSFKFNTVVINYYLNSLVFPRFARQFDTRLQSSGWDLVLPGTKRSPSVEVNTSHQASPDMSELTKPLTTGFSGTNDNRYIIPLNVAQTDLPGLIHTNAEVLSFLLQTRNRNYVVACDDSGRHLDEIALLQLLERRKISILIDAGAQISEHTNLDLAKAWLKVAKFAQAAAYFDDSNNLFVVYRNSDKIVPFSTSPFAESMTGCLMYFDQAHTRGVDVRLPADGKAALTLALDLTKDDAVQAAMRMRQLASTQSIVWISPPEVHKSILDTRKKAQGSKIDSHDVISWLMTQTCHYLESMQPLFCSQGIDYCRKQQAIRENPQFFHKPIQMKRLLASIRQTERQTLQKTYGWQDVHNYDLSGIENSSPVRPYANELDKLRISFSGDKPTVLTNAFSEVEQERETQQEIERVREVQKPTHFEPYPAPRRLDDALLSLLATGSWDRRSRDIEPVLDFLSRTHMAHEFDLKGSATTERLFVSPEFGNTVRTLDAGDMFIRPVNWILVDEGCTVAVIVSPDEAEMIIDMVRQMSETRAHLLLYAAPVTKEMSHFNRLDYMSIPSLPEGWRAPRWLSVELGVFAGRLYFDYEEYPDICAFLGLNLGNDSVTSEKNGVTDEDTADIGNRSGPTGFVSKPRSFLQTWLDLRRKGSDFSHTPMGFIAQGKPLKPDHLFFAKDPQPAIATPREDDDEGDGLEGVQIGDDVDEEVAW